MRIPGPGLHKKVSDYTFVDQLWIVVYIFILPVAVVLVVVGIVMSVSTIF